jgi:hypothetical protein
MSNTSAHSTNARKTRSMQMKQNASKQSDLQLVAERLALIQGHISHMPQTTCISGVVVMNGFLLVALNIPDHALSISVSGEWLLDGQNIIDYATNSPSTHATNSEEPHEHVETLPAETK